MILNDLIDLLNIFVILKIANQILLTALVQIFRYRNFDLWLQTSDSGLSIDHIWWATPRNVECTQHSIVIKTMFLKAIGNDFELGLREDPVDSLE